MSVPPSPSGRGELAIQPSFFTSSLYVNPLKDDVLRLIQTFSDAYALHATEQPFALFKGIWTRMGWPWMHLKVLDPRGREAFLLVTSRIFLERVLTTESAMSRVVGLFAFYCFFMTQPSTSTPRIHRVNHVPIPIDVYEALIALPTALVSTPPLLALRPQTIYITSVLASKSVFHILPPSDTYPQNPRTLPREVFPGDLNVQEVSRKKTGRPSKAERTQKAKAVFAALEKWLDKSCYPDADPADLPDTPAPERSTHILVSQRPTTSLNNYRALKAQLLELLTEDDGRDPEERSLEDQLVAALQESEPEQTASSTRRAVPASLIRANAQVLARLKHIDAMAAERGLEVGGEGGERTGLARVERAVDNLEKDGKGILALLEGGGLLDLTPTTESADTITPDT